MIFNNHLQVFCCLLSVYLIFSHKFANSTSVKVVKNSSEASLSSLNFSKVSRYLSERYNGTQNTFAFIGPEALRPLLDECFVYDSNKYYYRICPFKNVTQHEKSQYSLNFVTSTFHTVLGFWQGRLGMSGEGMFDSIIFRQGSDCDDNKVKRKVKLNLECLSTPKQIKQTTIVTEVTETKKCVYNIQIKSIFSCGLLGTVYSHLDSDGKTAWDGLQTMARKNIITEEEYSRSLESLLIEYGIEKGDTREFREQNSVDETLFEATIKENIELKKRISAMEKKLLELELNSTESQQDRFE